MTLHLDTSVIVSLLLPDEHAQRALALVSRHPPTSLAVSDLGRAEFAAVVVRRLRTADLTRKEAERALAAFDAWSASLAAVETTGTDIRAAETLIRRFDTPLRTMDAIHITIARRSGSDLATFDDGQAKAARRLGVSVET